MEDHHRACSVLVDVPAIDRTFDYGVPRSMVGQVEVGTMVRVALHGRRVGGWVLDPDSRPPRGVKLSPLAKVSSVGPDAELIDLCRWAAWRWAGRLATMLRLASPDRAVPVRPGLKLGPATAGEDDPLAAEALDRGPGAHLVQVSPDWSPETFAVTAARAGQIIFVTPSADGVTRVGQVLRRAGARAARWPRDYQAVLGGASVVGGRGAVFAPAPALAAIVVWDEHDEALQNESSPTWHAREVAVERARRAGVPCLLVSPAPSLEARHAATSPVLAPDRAALRSGWAQLVVVDRRGEDLRRTGLFSSTLVEQVRSTARSGGRVVCVLNRTGRARLLACRSCGTVADCERCGAAVRLTDELLLVCGSCGVERPSVCLHCGSTAMSVLRPGISRAREELEALVREPVELVAGGSRSSKDSEELSARVIIGTEAVLHRVTSAELVAFLDFDQELLAPRYRAAEEALALLVRASRLVGGRRSGGRVLVQTRRPDHEVIKAATRGDPDPLAELESIRRRVLGFPPAATIASVGGEAAQALIERLGAPLGVEVLGPEDGRWLLRAEDRAALLDALAAVERPPGRLRLWVDPARIR